MKNRDIKSNLSQFQRIIVAALYFLLLIVIFNLLGGNFKSLIWSDSLDSSIWFYSGAFMVILGSYVVEPYFTKPSDAIVNSLAVIVALLGLNNKEEFIGYNFIFWFSISIFILSIICIMLSDTNDSFYDKINKITYFIVKNLGSAKVIFSIVYLLAAYSYFATQKRLIGFVSIISFWIVITFNDLIGIFIDKISNLLDIFNKTNIKQLGEAIGCDNPFLYNVEIDYSNHIGELEKDKLPLKYGDIVAIETSLNTGSIGMVINKKYLLNKLWTSIYLLKDKNDDALKINLENNKLLTDSKSIFTEDNLVYKLDIKQLGERVKEKIKENKLYKCKENFVGYVTSGSNVNTINFTILRDLNNSQQKISEGTILETNIYGKQTLYQVIDGKTKEEHLQDFDNHGYTVGIARKFGYYNSEKKELNASKWMPSIYSPLFFKCAAEASEEKIEEMANRSIGRLPQTNLEIPIKDINSIVTHNTAILGILGIGKSCLAFEIIKKVIKEEVKIICLDITNQYYSEEGMKQYFSEELIKDDLREEAIEYLSEKENRQGSSNNFDSWGNKKHYKRVLRREVESFIEGEGEEKILILNPDLHPVTMASSKYNIESTKELTLPQKTRIISEAVLEYAKEKGQSDEAKYFLVYEEAHSLIPEFNSISSKGDERATNGTAKVILQGRKYGLGCLVITQRTANVSKSILNQCNTIFALRIFDDTGKAFLENYIGEDYANTLPTLEERHAIAMGKGLRLKQPVILELNDKKHITN